MGFPPRAGDALAVPAECLAGDVGWLPHVADQAAQLLLGRVARVRHRQPPVQHGGTLRARRGQGGHVAGVVRHLEWGGRTKKRRG